MQKSKPVTEHIVDTEYLLAKYNAVLAAFPDARSTYYMEFITKSVNKNYNKLDFDRRFGGLFVMPYSEINFSHNGKSEIIKVHSSPKSCRLVYLDRWGHRSSNKKMMRFSRLKFNLKNNCFKEDMLQSCSTEIIKFIADNPGYTLDDKHLDKRLKKLLMFI